MGMTCLAAIFGALSLLLQVSGPLNVEAESGVLSGAARLVGCSACSGGHKVGFIGNGASNAVTLRVSAAASGSRTMSIHYLVSGTRTLSYSVNGGAAVSLSLSGGSFAAVAPPRAVSVRLNAGSNTIRFFNNGGFAPDLDRITLSAAPVPAPTPTPPIGGDFSHSVVSSAPSEAQVRFVANGFTAGFVIVHYLVNDANQQNVYMTFNAGAGRWERTVSGLSTGARLTYSFTYLKTGTEVTSPFFEYVHGSEPGPSPTPTPNPSPTPGPDPTPTPSPGGWTLIWSDEFNGSGAPNSANWNYHVGNGFNPGLPGFHGWGNGEWEWYRPENCTQSGGNLVIRADYLSSPMSIAGRDWFQRSCRITTQGKRSFQYGRIEARIAAPSAAGVWPAFWMMGTSSGGTFTSSYAPPFGYYDTMVSNWASCGEVDILEKRNYENINVNNIFWDLRTGVFPFTAGQNGDYLSRTDINDMTRFHVYAIEWDQSFVRWFVDGRQTHVIDTRPGTLEEFRKPFYLIFNLALAGSVPQMDPNPAEFPLFMRVDYVRVYQRR